MGQAIAVRQDSLRRRCGGLRRERRMGPGTAAAGDSGGARWRAACGGGADRGNGPADAAGLGDPVQRAGPEGLINMVSPGAPPKLEDRAQGVSRAGGGGGADPGGAWCGALAGLRPDRAAA